MAKAKDLVIVESPAKAKTIEKYLGSGYKVTASMGHLRDLPKSKMGVDIEHGFEPQYIPVRDKRELINELKKEAKDARTVFLATDPDREGEAISWHLKELLELDDKKAKRVTFNAAASTRTWWTPSRRAASSTASWAMSSRPFSGKRSKRA